MMVWWFFFYRFQVLDPNPFPGLAVSPIHGVVPVGGHAELKVQLTPGAILKFDTKIQVAIKGGKTLELRMGGNVEPPTVDIDVVRLLRIYSTWIKVCKNGNLFAFKKHRLKFKNHYHFAYKEV